MFNNNLFNKTHLTQGIVDELLPILNEFDDCIWIKNKSGEYLVVNNSLCNLLGEDEESLLNSNGFNFFESSSFSFIMKDDLNVINKKKPGIMNEYLYINDREVLLQTHKIPILDSDNNCCSFLAIGKVIDNNVFSYRNFIIDNNYKGICNLITESQQNREKVAYEEINNHLRDIYESLGLIGISIWVYDDFKKDLFKKMGLGITENIFDNNSVPLNDIGRDELINTFNKLESPVLLENHKKLYCNTIFFKKHNDFLNNKYVLTLPIIYNNCKLLGVLNLYYEDFFYTQDNFKYLKRATQRIALFLKNICLSNELEYQLQKKVKLENELGKFLNMSADIYLIIDTNGYVKNMNSNIFSLLGWSFSDLEKIPIESFIESRDNSVNFKEVLLTYNKKCYGGICKVKCKDSSLKLIEWYYYHEQETNEIFITGKDITNFSKLEEKVVSLESKIEYETFKTDFLSNISHEFKTPLNIILASIQLELNHFDDIKDYDSIHYNRLNLIKQNSYRLLRLVDNLIDVTQVENENIKLYNENINIVYFIEEIVDSVSKYIAKMNRNIIFDTNEEEVFLACDPNKIEKVILNLISNSIKYTSANGNIYLTLTTNWDEQRVYISVKDDGVGIPKNSYNSVFEKFKQVDNLFIRRAEGSGIGLPLAKAFIELHNGEIWINKNLNIGSEFIFYLPIITLENSKTNYFYDKVINSVAEQLKIEFSDIYSYTN